MGEKKGVGTGHGHYSFCLSSHPLFSIPLLYILPNSIILLCHSMHDIIPHSSPSLLNSLIPLFLLSFYSSFLFIIHYRRFGWLSPSPCAFLLCIYTFPIPFTQGRTLLRKYVPCILPGLGSNFWFWACQQRRVLS